MKRQNTKRLEQGPQYPEWNGRVPELQLATAAIAARLSENRGGGGDLFLARDGGGDVISQVSHCKLRFESLL